jgi:glycosyltransferase involved in cell wall biosynthesis
VLWPTLSRVAGVAAHSLGVPCFWEMPNCVSDNYPFHINRRLLQRQCSRYGIVPLANSRYTAATLGEELVKPIAMHLSADPSRFDPETVEPFPRADLGIPADAIVLCIAARLHPSKGQLEIWEAMLRCHAEGADLHLLLLGGPVDGTVGQELVRRAEAAGLRDRLHLVGLVPDPERYFLASDVVVNSRIDAEPFGLTVIEAMMMGRPMLVHALGGPAETVIEGETGWHVTSPTVPAFARGIERALADRPRWPEMRAAARQHALRCFATRVHACNYAEVVQAVLGTREHA